MKRSSTLNLALVWAGAASLVTALAAVPFLAANHPATAAALVANESTFRAGKSPAAAQPVVVHPATITLVTTARTVIRVIPATQAHKPSTPATPRAHSTTAAATVRPTTARPTQVTKTPAIRKPVPAPAPDPDPAPAPAPAPAPKPPTSSAPAGDYIRIGTWLRSIIVARGSQTAINSCGPAAVWYGPMPGEGSGTTWLAGHNYCGFAFWDTLAMGTRLTIHDSAGTFVYQIVSRTRLDHQGGTAVGILHDDLILQTCTASGTSLTYADRVA